MTQSRGVLMCITAQYHRTTAQPTGVPSVQSRVQVPVFPHAS